MRTIAVITTARADYGMYRPVLRALQHEPGVRLQLIAAGMHMSERHGMTVHEIEADGFPIAERLDFLEAADTPHAIAVSAGRAQIAFADAFARTRPDVLLVLGDRFEMHAAVCAAVPFCIPVAHIAGGDVTEGAIDDGLRNSITKLSHIHLAIHGDSARRIVGMGEEAWRVTVTGAPSLDDAANFVPEPRAELVQSFGWAASERFLLVTYHPVTLEFAEAGAQIRTVLESLAPLDSALVITTPNADTNGGIIADAIREFAASRPKVHVTTSLGRRYFSAMAHADAMVGNSSSGVIEAASFGLPVVDIGDRQKGRPTGSNVIRVACDSREIRAAVMRACSREFRETLTDRLNPYGDGSAADRIVAVLTRIPLDERLLRKLSRPAEATTGVTPLAGMERSA